MQVECPRQSYPRPLVWLPESEAYEWRRESDVEKEAGDHEAVELLKRVCKDDAHSCRLCKFEGNPDNVRVLNKHDIGTFMEGGIEKLAKRIAEYKPCVVFVDPLDKFHGIEDGKVRFDSVANKVVGPLLELAQSTGVGIIFTYPFQ